MDIIFTGHAIFKLKLLREHGFTITQENVRNIILEPDFTRDAKHGRKAAHKNLRDNLMVRVIYEKNDNVVVVTVMIVLRERYEKDKIR